ncbi:hypothetical protein [Auraticoccus monumenti]|nr:hypothetical protein [Auraticoccus monumenti]
MLMEPLGFGYRRLYLAFLDADGLMLPDLVEIDGVPASADPRECRQLLTMCAGVLHDVDSAASLAILYCRPGPGPVRAADRTWPQALRTAAARQGASLWPTHVACDDFLTLP